MKQSRMTAALDVGHKEVAQYLYSTIKWTKCDCGCEKIVPDGVESLMAFNFYVKVCNEFGLYPLRKKDE